MMEVMDRVVREVPGRGHLPMLRFENLETGVKNEVRGEYQKTPEKAWERTGEMLAEYHRSMETTPGMGY